MYHVIIYAHNANESVSESLSDVYLIFVLAYFALFIFFYYSQFNVTIVRDVG